MSFITKVLQSVSLIASLPQSATNGNSVLGTLNTTTYPKWLPNEAAPVPWGNRTVETTNRDTDVPDTGVVRPYDFTIERAFIAPDGVNRSVILINGAFPGPLIEANWGDTISVTVHNKISEPEEGTALHWHGLTQQKTPWYDGVPSVQQCPIAPGKTFKYEFQASSYGSSWYHSHYSAQYAGGAFGPMMIHGPVQKDEDAQYDEDLGPIILSDWYHREYFDIIENVVMVNNTVPPNAPPPPQSDNNLMQGKGVYDCSLGVPNNVSCTDNAGMPKFEVTKNKRYRLRLINTSAEAAQKFSIDDHNMTVIANDFVPVKPYSTNVVTLGVGQRSDIVLETNQTGDAFWMRSNISSNLSLVANQKQRLALAALYYEGADTDKTPKSTAQEWVESDGNDDLLLTEPVYKIPATTEGDIHTVNVNISFGANDTSFFLFEMNNSSFRANYDHPLLLLANKGNTSYPDDPQWNVYNTGGHKTVRLVITSDRGISHPLHLHGHDFQVLAEGPGTWDGETIVRAENPQRRDVQLMLPKPNSHLVLQFEQDNPGVWPFHCHIAWHVSQGLYINIMERPDDILKQDIPDDVTQTCREWWDYSGHNVVNQIDSGLRKSF